jgi:hypothetical protein
MVAGSIGKVGTVYTVSARIFDVQTGKILKSVNYDHIGDIGQLLIKGMKAVVQQLITGIPSNNQVEINTEKASSNNLDNELQSLTKSLRQAMLQDSIEAQNQADLDAIEAELLAKGEVIKHGQNYLVSNYLNQII